MKMNFVREVKKIVKPITTKVTFPFVFLSIETAARSTDTESEMKAS
jgi:hypothetical protein